MTTKTYPVDVVLSVASHKMLCESFADLHEAVTDLAGWPVMTHHMADQSLMDTVAAKVIRQVPWMPGAIENMPTFSGDNAEGEVRAYIARLRWTVGDTVMLDLGEPLPAIHPLAGLLR